MSKVNIKAIREEERKKIIKQYSERISNLEDALHKEQRLRIDALNAKTRLLEENDDLKEKVRSYEEWIERLHEYVNMGPEERDVAIAQLREERKNKELFSRLLDGPLKMFTKYITF